ncbi:MAG: alpha/beta hydrolase, partial [Ignavibacteria bacterium]
INDKTQNVWFVLHGYGQLAGDFIKSVEQIADNNTVIIAPEALSKFYQDHGNGKIGANWMTKEDRDNEINDYVNYLDELYSKVIKDTGSPGCKINALGFSQGAATVSRWAELGKTKFNKLIFWAGEIAKDVEYKKIKESEIHLVFGNNDPVFPGEFYKTQEELLDKHGLKYKTHIFEGKHEINKKLLWEIVSL